MSTENKQLSDAESYEEFRSLRTPPTPAAAEPAAEKAPQVEETTPVIAAESGTVEPNSQEKQEPVPAEKSVDEQVRELRAKGKHAAANKLMVDSAVDVERKRADALARELESLRAKPVAAQPQPAASPVPPAAPQVAGDDPEPKPTDEKYSVEGGWNLYMGDKIAHGIRSATRAEAETQKRAAHEQRGRKALEAGAAAHPDFGSVIEKVIISKEALMSAVDNIDNVGEVLYKIGTNPAELARIQTLNPFSQYAVIHELSQGLKAPTPAAAPAPPVTLPPPVSRVAPPPRTLTGVGEAPKRSTADAKDYDDFRRIRKAG